MNLIGYVDCRIFTKFGRDRETLVQKSVLGFKNIRNIFPVTPLCVTQNEKFPIGQL